MGTETPAVCSHGSLRRSCEICERDAEIERLRAERDEAIAAARHLKNLVTSPLTEEDKEWARETMSEWGAQRMSDRASELRAIADGRLMLHVRNGVTVARSMLARIADEFETMSTALAAKGAELAEVHQRYVDANEARIDAEAQLAEARKALDRIANVVGEDEPSIMWPWAQEIARSVLKESGS